MVEKERKVAILIQVSPVALHLIAASYVSYKYKNEVQWHGTAYVSDKDLGKYLSKSQLKKYLKNKKITQFLRYPSLEERKSLKLITYNARLDEQGRNNPALPR